MEIALIFTEFGFVRRANQSWRIGVRQRPVATNSGKGTATAGIEINQSAKSTITRNGESSKPVWEVRIWPQRRLGDLQRLDFRPSQSSRDQTNAFATINRGHAGNDPTRVPAENPISLDLIHVLQLQPRFIVILARILQRLVVLTVFHGYLRAKHHCGLQWNLGLRSQKSLAAASIAASEVNCASSRCSR